MPLLLTLAACAPTEGVSTAFKVQPTTNFDFNIASVAVGNNPLDIAVADYNGVNGPDLAVANQLDGTVTVLTNNGSGVFAARTVAVGDRPFRVLWFNLTGAAPLGLAVLTQVQTGTAFTHRLVIAADGGAGFAVTKSYDFGTFVAQIEAFCAGLTPCLAATRQDLVASVPLGKAVTVFTNADLSAGSSTLTPVVTGTSFNAAFYNPTRFAVGAIDAGTVPDLAVLLPGANVLLPLIGSGSGGFTPGTAVALPAVPYAIAGGELNGAAGTDFVVTSLASNIASILLNDGTGTLSRSDYYVTTAGEVLIGAIAGTPNDDILVADRNQEQVTYLKNGSPGAGAFSGSVLFATRDPFAFAVGTNSATANKDFVSAEAAKRVLGVYQGNGLGGFTRTQIGFESLPTHPTTVNGLCGNAPAKDDLVALQPNVDAVLVFCRK